MTTGAMAFFLKSGRSVQKQYRMDRVQAGQQSPAAQGSGVASEPDTGARQDFAAVYGEIAQQNVRAHNAVKTGPLATDKRDASTPVDCASFAQGNVPVAGSEPATSVDPAMLPGQADNVSCTDSNSNENSAVSTAAAQTGAIISQSLLALSSALHLDVDPELKQLSISGKPDETAGQLVDIVCSLKKIAALFDGAVAENQQIDLGSTVIDVPQSRALATLIHAQVLRIEAAASMLGMGTEISSAIAEKLQVPFGGNIPQAYDPSQLSMPQSQVQQLLQQMSPEASADVAALAQKIRELCAGQPQTRNNQVNITVAATDGKEPFTGNPTQANGMVQFDTSTMRKILKIDGEPAGDDDAGTAMKSDTGEQIKNALTLAVRNSTGTVAGRAEDVQPVLDALSKSLGGDLLSAAAESKAPVLRTPDDSVMDQVTEKLTAAVRSGVTEVSIQLRPESLGEVKLRIRLEGDVVFARIQVESQQIKQIVETNMQTLKDALSFQHLQAGSLEVSVGSDGGEPPREGQSTEAGCAADSDAAGKDAGKDNSRNDSTQMITGRETGRRFGENTVEYFA